MVSTTTNPWMHLSGVEKKEAPVREFSVKRAQVTLTGTGQGILTNLSNKNTGVERSPYNLFGRKKPMLNKM